MHLPRWSRNRPSKANIMQTPLNWWQKLIAYSALLFVLFWTLFGIFVIWVYMTE